MRTAHIALGNALARADRAKEAAEAYRAALAISIRPSRGLFGARTAIESSYRQAGRGDYAIHRENLLRNPDNAEPYWALANMKTYHFSDRDIDSMESLLYRKDLDELAEVQLCNALGFAHEKREDYRQGIHLF